MSKIKDILIFFKNVAKKHKKKMKKKNRKLYVNITFFKMPKFKK